MRLKHLTHIFRVVVFDVLVDLVVILHEKSHELFQVRLQWEARKCFLCELYIFLQSIVEIVAWKIINNSFNNFPIYDSLNWNSWLFGTRPLIFTLLLNKVMNRREEVINIERSYFHGQVVDLLLHLILLLLIGFEFGNYRIICKGQIELL